MDMAPSPPDLTGYETWADGDGFHATYATVLPAEAIAYGRCLQEVHADTALELTQMSVRNRVRIWAWQAAQRSPKAGELPWQPHEPA